MVYHVGYWYVTGYCYLRGDRRTLRVDRISKVDLRGDVRERPTDFDALSFVLRSIASWPETEQIEVLLMAPLEQVEQFLPPVMGTLEVADNGVFFRRTAVQLEWVVPTLFNNDAPMQINKADELRQLVRTVGD